LKCSGYRKIGYGTQHTGERCDFKYGHLTSGGSRFKPVSNRNTAIDHLYLLVTSKASETSDELYLPPLKNSKSIPIRYSCRPMKHFELSLNPNTRVHKSLGLNQNN
jgi:hypothetical protein